MIWKCQSISIHQTMDSGCVIGILIKLTLWIYLEKFEGKLETPEIFQSGNRNTDTICILKELLIILTIKKSWKIGRIINILEILETYITAFESD